eukprot:scaffold68950_cov22-Prasinocladus_malaysianus.AAC.2
MAIASVSLTSCAIIFILHTVMLKKTLKQQGLRQIHIRIPRLRQALTCTLDSTAYSPSDGVHMDPPPAAHFCQSKGRCRMKAARSGFDQ